MRSTQQILHHSQDMVVQHISWIPPSDDSWKLKIAGCVGPDGSGSGCNLRDQNAMFKAASAGPLKDCRDLMTAKLDALHNGLLIAMRHGVDYIEIEGDQSLVIQLLQGKQAMPFSETCKMLLQECFDCIKYFRNVKVRQICKISNDAANKVAKIGDRPEEPYIWDGFPPTELVNTLVTDVIGRWIL